jgi:hypothetical protein
MEIYEDGNKADEFGVTSLYIFNDKDGFSTTRNATCVSWLDKPPLATLKKITLAHGNAAVACSKGKNIDKIW